MITVDHKEGREQAKRSLLITASQRLGVQLYHVAKIYTNVTKYSSYNIMRQKWDHMDLK